MKNVLIKLFGCRSSGMLNCVCAVCVLGLTVSVRAAPLSNLLFLHHSVGQGLLEGGNIRGVIAAYNAVYGTEISFWDQGYSWEALIGPDGVPLDGSYVVPGDDTSPAGLYYFWTSAEEECSTVRNAVLNNHQAIAFKSCYPASAISDAAALALYKDYYLGMRAVFDQYPERLFIVMSTPPLRRIATNPAAAGNARLFADWLSGEYVAGHSNIVCFNLFDYLADEADNMLRTAYEPANSDQGDSHPNALANQTVGQSLAEFFIASLCDFGGPTSDDPEADDPSLERSGPLIRVNGVLDEVTAPYLSPVRVTVEMNPLVEHLGALVDWWIIAAPQSGDWYYLNADMQWIPFTPGYFQLCEPVCRGGLGVVPETPVLNNSSLSRDVYTFYFAVDPMDGVLRTDGPILYDAVAVTVE